MAGTSMSNGKSLKAKQHRRRHVPVGPAGVWFQQQEHGDDAATSWADDSVKRQRTDKDIPSYVTSSAWIRMQCDLQVVTPQLPVLLSVTERHQRLRPHLPSDFVLIDDLPPSNWQLPPGKRLVVLVQSIQSHTDHLWTVVLEDEAGKTINAWVEPQFVLDKEKWIRTGSVWSLQNTTLMLVDRKNDDSTNRMLLIGSDNVERCWLPGLDLSDKDYVNWLERRNDVSARANVSDEVFEQQAGDMNDDEPGRSFAAPTATNRTTDTSCDMSLASGFTRDQNLRLPAPTVRQVPAASTHPPHVSRESCRSMSSFRHDEDSHLGHSIARMETPPNADSAPSRGTTGTPAGLFASSAVVQIIRSGVLDDLSEIEDPTSGRNMSVPQVRDLHGNESTGSIFQNADWISRLDMDELTRA